MHQTSKNQPIDVADHSPSRWQLELWARLLRIRPAQLGELAKRLLRVQNIMLRDHSGNKFYVDPVSIFGQEVLLTGVFEPNLTRIVQRLVRDADTFLDVGANIGYFSVLAAQQGPNVRVIAIEPQSRLQERIRKNIELNQCDNVQVIRTALADREGQVTMYLRPSGNTGGSSLFPYWRLGRNSELVPCQTLDRVLCDEQAGRIRFMKVDCEGAEHLVIKGAAKMIAERQVEYLALEYHRAILGRKECLETDRALRDCGYILSTCDGVAIYHQPGSESELQELAATYVDHPLEI